MSDRSLLGFPVPDFKTKTLLRLDFETRLGPKLTLKKMSLRRYLAATEVTALSMKLGDGPTMAFMGMAQILAILPTLRDLFARDDVIVTAHNSPFDLRVCHYKLGLDWPQWSLCTLDLARAAWPNLFQSYSLDYLSKSLQGMPAKLSIDLNPGKHTDIELMQYVMRDVDAHAKLLDYCMSRVPNDELAAASRIAKSRELSMAIDHVRAAKALDLFAGIILKHADDAKKGLDLRDLEEFAQVFGLDGDKVKSIKAAGLKKHLAEHLSFRTDTISIKKINPEKLRLDPVAGAALRDISKINGTLSHQRRVSALMNDAEVDFNLRFAGSHTYRSTSTGEGKGINFLNLPKHDKAVAKPLRQIISIKDHLLVRGDAASLEYRMAGWWTDCAFIRDLYTKDVMADPYIEFGVAATGVRCSPKDPVRQVWKTCVLGLTFLMRPRTHALAIARMLATAAAEAVASGKPAKITLDDLRAMCKSNGWRMPQTQYYRTMKTQLGLDDAVITVAHHTHALFNHVHPEFQEKASWLMELFDLVSRSNDPMKAVEAMYRLKHAPARHKVGIVVDPGMVGKSLAVCCGPWWPTLRWSDIGVRQTKYNDVALSIITQRGYWPVTENLLIENITQAMGRNAMSLGLGKLHYEHGWDHVMDVHDEGLAAVRLDADVLTNVARARADMTEIFKPGGFVAQKFDWACVMDPKKITISRTLWDEDPADFCPDLWDRVAAGDMSVLDLLP